MNFTVFKAAVAQQFERMQKHQLFRVAVEKDALWAMYLQAFPPGTNQLYRKRTEYDCSCCRQFVRSVGDVVAVIDGEIVSIWDISVPAEPVFEVVARELAAMVKAAPIASPFLHYERHAGTDRNFEQLTEGTTTWQHFFVNIDSGFVAEKSTIPTKLGEKRAQHDVLLRSLSEITDDAVQTVLDLIAQNSLYRGEEHKAAVLEFQRVKAAFNALPTAAARGLFAWTANTFESVSRMRNTVIGTLLVDLSTGVELEPAVKAFEVKVAPTNYKRPTALVTPAMIAKAKAEVEALGLTSALQRRYAVLTDITVNNVLFADRSARTAMGGDVFADLAAAAPATPKNFDRLEEVPIDKFLAEVLPRASSIEVLVENKHNGNMVSLIAPVDPTAQRLFKWDNGFSWSYAGDVADSIKERVKAAGGNVTGDLCCRLAWESTDDLDFHMREPGGYTIYFPYKRQISPCGGVLDVDANGGDGMRTDPAENIVYVNRARMQHGTYQLLVHQYSRRQTVINGFRAQVDLMGTVHEFEYSKPVPQGAEVHIAEIVVTSTGIKVFPKLPSTSTSRPLWGLDTQTFRRVNVVLLSPNHWDDKAVGNKHYFFMLDGCANPDQARGFYNEFLRSDFDPHRKVMELIGSRLKTVEASEQLSGLGFSSTSKNTLVVRVKGSFTRDLRVTF